MWTYRIFILSFTAVSKSLESEKEIGFFEFDKLSPENKSKDFFFWLRILFKWFGHWDYHNPRFQSNQMPLDFSFFQKAFAMHCLVMKSVIWTICSQTVHRRMLKLEHSASDVEAPFCFSLLQLLKQQVPLVLKKREKPHIWFNEALKTDIIYLFKFTIVTLDIRCFVPRW